MNNGKETVNGWANPMQKLEMIKTDVLKVAETEKKWYANLRGKMGVLARTVRFITIALFAFGTIYPLLNQAFYNGKSANLDWGYISLFAGCVFLLLDKFFGLSSSFVRFYVAEIEIQKNTYEFQEAWEMEMAKAAEQLTIENIQNLLTIAKTLRLAIYHTIEMETTAWATEWQTQISELQELMKQKQSENKHGNISVTLENTKLYKEIEVGLDDTYTKKMNGQTATIFRNVSVAPHVIHIKARKDQTEEIFSKNVEVTADRTESIIMSLP